jgi:hypothetical protein
MVKKVKNKGILAIRTAALILILFFIILAKLLLPVSFIRIFFKNEESVSNYQFLENIFNMTRADHENCVGCGCGGCGGSVDSGGPGPSAGSVA